MMNATVWVTFEAIDKIEYFVVHDMLTGEKKKMGNRESLSFYHGEISFFHPKKGENPALFIR